MKKRQSIYLCFILLNLLLPYYSFAQVGLWTSGAELAGRPMSGAAWEAVKQAADQGFYPPVIENNNHPSNVNALAAGIVYARLSSENNYQEEAQTYRNKVVAALEYLVAQGKPDNCPDDLRDCNRLRWARNTGAFVLAADLIDYRKPEFESWCRNMAEVYKDVDDVTLLEMFKKRASNWGAMAFGSLSTIYAYLQDTVRLAEIRNYWIHGVEGSNPGYKTFKKDWSWHYDRNDPRLINPKDSKKNGLIIDGVIPNDQRRCGSFQNPPCYTNYHWGHLQGVITAARILDRIGLPIWDTGDRAIYRAAYQYQIRWDNEFGGFAAKGDDQWLLPFLDNAYGTSWSAKQKKLWMHGKIAGWPYVVWNGKE